MHDTATGDERGWIRLAEALGVSVEVLEAVELGEIVNVGLMAFWPTGGNFTLNDETLVAWRECRADVERYGIEAVRDAEDRAITQAREARAPIDKPTPPKRAERYHLYRLFAADDRLLYVGITRNLDGRLKAHDKRWGDVIERTESVEFDNHTAALAAEAAEIAEKCPPFNHDGVGQ